MAEGNEIPNEELPENQDQGNLPDPEQSIEERARVQGWMPYEEWVEAGNNPDDWVGAEAFLVKGDFIRRLKKQSKKMQEMEEVINELAEHNKKIAEREFKEEQNRLKQEKADALQRNDTERAVEIDEELKQIEQQYNSKVESADNQAEAQKQQAQAGEGNTEFDEWVSRPENQWYVNDPILRGAADKIADQVVEQNPNATFDEVVTQVERQLAQELPERFPKSKKGQQGGAAPVNETSMSSKSQNRGGAKTGKNLVRKMSEDQRAIADKFVRQGVFDSVESYAKQLNELGEL